MNEQEALEYARKIMVCETCKFFNIDSYACKIITYNFSAVDWCDDKIIYDGTGFGCNQWQPKE